MKSHNAWPGQWNPPQHEYQHYMTTSCYMIITGPTLLLQYYTTTTTIATSNTNNLTTTSNIYATTILPCPCLILLHGVSYIPAKQKEFLCCRWTQRRQWWLWHDNKTTVGRWYNNQQYGNNDNTTMIQQQININTTLEQSHDSRTRYNDTTVNDDEETMWRSIGWILLINWLYFINLLDLIVLQTCHCLPLMILLLLSLVKFDCCIIHLLLSSHDDTPFPGHKSSMLSSLDDTHHYLPSMILAIIFPLPSMILLYLVLAAMTRLRRSSTQWPGKGMHWFAYPISISHCCFNYKRHWLGIWHVC